MRKYEFIRDRIMHGTTYKAQIREDLTFTVYNLFGYIKLPGKNLQYLPSISLIFASSKNSLESSFICRIISVPLSFLFDSLISNSVFPSHLQGPLIQYSLPLNNSNSKSFSYDNKRFKVFCK